MLRGSARVEVKRAGALPDGRGSDALAVLLALREQVIAFLRFGEAFEFIEGGGKRFVVVVVAVVIQDGLFLDRGRQAAAFGERGVD